MFTGIIEAIGHIREVEQRGADARLTIDADGLDLGDVVLGDSIAVNGVCLTVIELAGERFKVDVSAETLRCTQGLQVRGEVNLEKALKLADRLGGHIVSGHVDGVGEVTRFLPVGESHLLEIRAPESIAKFIAAKGSITVNGVSLTVNDVVDELFQINLIPHTLAETNLKHLAAGSHVNLEVDTVARYVERLLSFKK